MVAIKKSFLRDRKKKIKKKAELQEGPNFKQSVQYVTGWLSPNLTGGKKDEDRHIFLSKHHIQLRGCRESLNLLTADCLLLQIGKCSV